MTAISMQYPLMLKAVQFANIPPVANNDPATTGENTPVDINVIANDTDSDGTIDPATVAITGNPTNGSAVAHTDGTVTYTPDNGFDGTDTFTYTVNDNQGATSNQATVTVTVGSVTSGFSDNFSTNTTGDYTITHTWTDGGLGSFLYDPAGQRARVFAGDNIGLQFSHPLPPLDTGTFSIDFLPTQKYPYGGWLYIRLVQDANNYYDIQNTDGYGPKAIRKIVNGTVVDSASFTSQYTQNTNYHITVNFSPDQTTVNAFGQSITISTNKSSIPVNRFEIEVQQQDAYFDNISYIQ